MIKKLTKYNVIFTIIIIFMFILALANISNRTMFIDESIEAMLGKNVLEYGVPKAWDGKNLIMAEVNGNEFNEEFIYIRKNWVSNYIAAFGQLLANTLNLSVYGSVAIMRILFVLIGICGAVGFYYLCKELTSDKIVPLVALSLFAFSIPLLLYIRSIYYLAPTLTCMIMSILCYIKFIKERKPKHLYLFTIFSVLLFHSFYPYFIITMATLAIVFFLFDFKKEMLKERVFKQIIISITVILLLTVPWYIYARLFLSKVEHGLVVSFDIFIESLLGYIWQIHTYFLPFLPLIAICIFFAMRNRKRKHSELPNKDVKTKFNKLVKYHSKYKFAVLVSLQIFINLFLISSTTNFLDTRRLIGAIPFLYFVLAVAICYILKRQKAIGYAVLAICLFTNILHVSPYLLINTLKIEARHIESVVKPPLPYFNVDENWLNKKTDLKSYLNNICKAESNFQYYIEEIFNDYNDADEGIVKFLNTYAESNQKVLIIGYQYETVAYYTNCQVVNRLDPKNDPLPSGFKAYPNAEKFQFLTYCPIEQCDWIIERRLNSGAVISNAVWHDEKLFERYYIDYPDAKPWNEIWDHSFITDDSFNGVYIFRNKLTTSPIDLPSNIFQRGN
jgi:hypothetical protein